MNNLLKIFLIFNLFSSVAPANNYSQPLPETELHMGQNSSELVERDKSISVYGGMNFLGITIMKGGSTCETPCTFSFPVSNGNEKGFLTSNLCASNSVFSTDGDLIGSVQSNKFDAKRGLDYAFVSIYSNYWSDEISSKVDYYQCGTSTSGSIYEIEENLPIIPTPNQPLSVGDTVYVHGGEDSGTAHGKILATDVKIRLGVPGTCGKNWVNDFKAIKMEMNKEFELSFLGAPVYLVVQVPGSTQIIASPVGQVVRGVGPSSTRPGYDPNKIWYYIPLEPILKDSGLKLVVGDLSYLLPPNNTESNNDYLADDLTKESNVSDVNNLVERQPQRQIALTHAGLRMWIFTYGRSGIPPANGNIAKKCTLGFAVRKIRGNHRFDHGFLTLGYCMPSSRGNSYNAYYNPNQNWVQQEAIRLGNVASLGYDPAQGLNHALLRLLPNSDQLTLWDDDISADMPVMWGDEERMVDVYNQARVPNVQEELCWWGASSGNMCGIVVDTQATLAKLNPWRWPIYVEVVLPLIINGQPIPIGLQWNPEDTFQNLIKVRVDEAYQPQDEEGHKSDSGAPVYYPHVNRLGLATQAQPVGILLDYIQETENRDNQCVIVWYMYCISVDRIMSSLNANPSRERYELIGENFA